MKLPLLREELDRFPNDDVCPVCRKAKVGEPHSFASLQGGAALVDSSTGTGGPSPLMRGYLYLHWHGAHDSGKGVDPEVVALTPIADSVKGGQFALYACSTQCLRELLGHLVDQLDQEIKRSRRTMARRIQGST